MDTIREISKTRKLEPVPMSPEMFEIMLEMDKELMEFRREYRLKDVRSLQSAAEAFINA